MSKKPNDATKYTQLFNITEAIKCGILTNPNLDDSSKGQSSKEHRYARCKCCFPIVDLNILNDKNRSVWYQKEYEFLKQNYTDKNCNVHPGLWDNGMSNLLSGVFEVLKGRIYQVRGYDMANITFIKSNHIENINLSKDDHWIVMDTLMSKECTLSAIECFEQFLQSELINADYVFKGKVSAIIISHSHIDHFGGMEVVYDYRYDDVIPIIAPEGFFENAISENIYVGNAMERRASYQFGSFIKPSLMSNGYETCGNVSIGIGQGQSTGTVGLMKPTLEIGNNIDENNFKNYVIDELIIYYQLTPGTEAPSEMNNYFPQYKALWLAENCSATLHNLYAIRGAQVRDGSAWAQFLVETAELYGDSAEVIFQSHNWPHWREMNVDGKTKTIDLKYFILETAAIYKFINDQTLLYINMGYKMNEISEMLVLPKTMQDNWTIKPFYGTPEHNAKAVYQKYLGWYDANPLRLNELSPELLAKETVRYVQDTSCSMLEKIQKDYDVGNYWIAAHMAHQIVMGSENETEINKAKQLCADSLEQLGYQAQSGVWRNAYLCASSELRNGKKRVSISVDSEQLSQKGNGNGMFGALNSTMLLDYISILFNGDIGSANVKYSGILNIIDTDKNTNEKFYFHVINGSILYKFIKQTPIDCNKNLIENKPTENDCVVTKKQLMLLIAKVQGMIPSVVFNMHISSFPEIFRKISACMVNIKCDRYRSFDIMEKHDSSVLIDGKTYNLKTVAKGAIELLNKQNFENYDSVITIEEWIYFYNILIKNSGVLLDANIFFTLSESNIGVSKGIFGAKEYYYTLCGLYRYIIKPYLINNRFSVDKDNENKIIIKEKIRFLEEFSPSFYLDGDKEIKLNDTERETVKWFNKYGNKQTISMQFNATEFYKTLSLCYEELYKRIKD